VQAPQVTLCCHRLLLCSLTGDAIPELITTPVVGGSDYLVWYENMGAAREFTPHELSRSHPSSSRYLDVSNGGWSIELGCLQLLSVSRSPWMLKLGFCGDGMGGGGGWWGFMFSLWA
jgi:hypothetical protein